MRILFDMLNIYHVIYKMYYSFEVLHTIYQCEHKGSVSIWAYKNKYFDSVAFHDI
jgi:hypothetical protein